MDKVPTWIFKNNDLITFYLCYSVDKYFGFNIDGLCPSTVYSLPINVTITIIYSINYSVLQRYSTNLK